MCIYILICIIYISINISIVVCMSLPTQSIIKVMSHPMSGTRGPGTPWTVCSSRVPIGNTMIGGSAFGRLGIQLVLLSPGADCLQVTGSGDAD